MNAKRLSKISTALVMSAGMVLVNNPSSLVGPGDQSILGSPARAASIEISFFYDRLGRHGTWVHHRRHGYVFVPAVKRGWRPYVHGHWVYTDRYGWYWVSDEPFAWAVYHYGRWAYDPAFGWYWVPGNVWAPAWVTWRHGGGHVGWAPIGPHGDGYVYGTPDYYEPPIVEAWVFVPERRFVAVDVARFVAPVIEINLFLGKSRERHHVRYRDGRAYNPFLPRQRVTKIVNQEINVYNITNVNDPDQASSEASKGKKNSIPAFQAEVSERKPKEKPEKVASQPDEVKQKPTLDQTATKGEKPADAPPSAAELKPEPAAGEKPVGQKQDSEPKPDQQPTPKPDEGPKPQSEQAPQPGPEAGQPAEPDKPSDGQQQKDPQPAEKAPELAPGPAQPAPQPQAAPPQQPAPPTAAPPEQPAPQPQAAPPQQPAPPAAAPPQAAPQQPAPQPQAAPAAQGGGPKPNQDSGKGGGQGKIKGKPE